MPEIEGGLILQTPSCATRYLIMVYAGIWILASDPRECGAMACTSSGGQWLYTRQDIEKLLQHGWTIQGQPIDLDFSRVIAEQSRLPKAPKAW